MRITDVQVDGFGVWSNLKLEQLSDGLTVFYGPNEAGKTTLMQFIRTLLHGFSVERSRRYLPPLSGNRPGGILCVAGPNGRFELERHLPEGAKFGDGEEINITAADGTVHGSHFLNVLLSGVDETIFNNVFAVGLREMQELGTLSDTQAAQLLYDLSVGLDHVSLVDVMRNLEKSREKLLNSGDQASVITKLLASREQLHSEIQNLESISANYTDLCNQRDHLKHEITELETDSGQYENQLREIDLAATLAEKWQQRKELDKQISAIGPVNDVSGALLHQLHETNQLLASRDDYRIRVKNRKQTIRQRARKLPINKELWRVAPKIEALNEQRPWLETIERRMKELNVELELADSQIHSERSKLGFDQNKTSDHTWTNGQILSSNTLSKLKPLSRLVKEAKAVNQRAEDELFKHQQESDDANLELQSALSELKEKDLTTALENTGELVSKLRRRIAADEKIDQLQFNEKELEQDIQTAMHNRVLPGWTMIATGAGFALGFVLILVGFFLPSLSAAGWTIAILGLIATAIAAGTKIMLERSAEKKLESSTQQLELVQLQIEKTKQEREELNKQLPSGGGPLPVRLQSAEQRLADFERLLPLQTQFQSANQKTQVLLSQAEYAQLELEKVENRWKTGLLEAGLPEDCTLSQVKVFAKSRKYLLQMRQDYDRNASELTQLQQSFDAVKDRVNQLAEQTGLISDRTDPLAQIQQLVSHLREQENLRIKHEHYKRKYRKMKRKDRKCARSIAHLKRRRNELVIQAGVDSEDQLRTMVARYDSHRELRHKHDAIQQHLIQTIAGQCSEQTLATYLDDGDMGQLERKYDDLVVRVGGNKNQLKSLYERLGSLNENLKTLCEDRRICHAQLDLNCIEKQLDNSYRQWQILAVTSHILDTIRREYETDRQPETLQEASVYLRRMTQDRYLRVWTPLGKNELRVDDQQGESLPIEVLSRGTREQLFLSLRLSIAASYARRGAFIPLVLDDVLVNFDADRASAAAEVLRDFAEQGHQILLFTCHDHIQKIFKSAKVDVRRLPDRRKHDSEMVVTGSVKKPSKTKKKQAKVEVPLPVEPAPVLPKPVKVIESPTVVIEKVVERSVAKKQVPPKKSPAASPIKKTQPEQVVIKETVVIEETVVEAKPKKPVPVEKEKSTINAKPTPRFGPFTWDDNEKLKPLVAKDVLAEKKKRSTEPDDSGFWEAEQTVADETEELEDEIVLEDEEDEEEELVLAEVYEEEEDETLEEDDEEYAELDEDEEEECEEEKDEYEEEDYEQGEYEEDELEEKEDTEEDDEDDELWEEEDEDDDEFKEEAA